VKQWQAEHPEAVKEHQVRRRERIQERKLVDRRFVETALDRVLAMFETPAED
jgi:hypothetical protein